ncbi:hypothetical protein ACOME3_005431 [Neoechinorhynchus agilis]
MDPFNLRKMCMDFCVLCSIDRIDHRIVSYDLKKWHECLKFSEHPSTTNHLVTMLKCMKNDRILYFCSKNYLYRTKLDSLKKISPTESIGPVECNIASFDVSDDEVFVALALCSKIDLYSLNQSFKNNEDKLSLSGHFCQVKKVIFTINGRYLISFGENDQIVIVWDTLLCLRNSTSERHWTLSSVDWECSICDIDASGDVFVILLQSGQTDYFVVQILGFVSGFLNCATKLKFFL